MCSFALIVSVVKKLLVDLQKRLAIDFFPVLSFAFAASW
jgi:hypothetical protein